MSEPVSADAKIDQALVVAKRIERDAIAEKGMLAAASALVDAAKVRKRPAKESVPAALVLSPAEYRAALKADPEYHASFPVALGEPAVIDGYLVFDDPGLT